MRTSAETQTLSPATTLALPEARAMIFSVNVISGKTLRQKKDYSNAKGRQVAGV
jgi:hypothetical protein